MEESIPELKNTRSKVSANCYVCITGCRGICYCLRSCLSIFLFTGESSHSRLRALVSTVKIPVRGRPITWGHASIKRREGKTALRLQFCFIDEKRETLGIHNLLHKKLSKIKDHQS